MRTRNNHIYVQIRGLLKNCFYRWPVHKESRCFQAFFAQSLCYLLDLAMLSVEFFRKRISSSLWVRFEFKDVRCRLRVMQDPYLG